MSGNLVAILIGIRKYDTQPELPGCSNDLDAMNTLLTLSGKVDGDNLLLIDDKRRSAEIKNLLADFIERHRTTPTAELLFYFSGHGTFDDDFRCLLPDYRDDQNNGTTLTNTELDGMLRSLNPTLTVKIIDACQSGVSYVKDADAVKAAIDRSRQGLKDCYFMFSSQQNQSSYQ